MGDKKTRKGLDTLRGDIQVLTEVVADLRDKLAMQHAFSSADHIGGFGSSQPLSDVTRSLQARARAAHESGSISAYGYFQGNDEDDTPQVYRWSLEDRSAQAVLDGPVTQYAHTLAAIGHPQRLNILLMLLSEPATANDVVSQLELGTTGAAYHHLNVLQAAGFVEQQHRGTFTMVPHRIPVLLTILASLSNGMAIEVLDSLPEDEEEEDLEVDHELDNVIEPIERDMGGEHIAGPAA